MGLQKRNTEAEIAAARAKKQAAATEQHEAGKRARAAARADILARTSAADVLEMTGFKLAEPGSYPKYRHPARASSIVLYPDGGWYDNLTQKGCKAGELASAALAKLLGFSIFSDEQAVLRVPVDARPKAPPAPPAEIPKEVIENWKFARDYLIQIRKIPAEIVDALRSAGQVYADWRKQVIFKRDGGVFIRSSTTDWKQSIGVGAAPFVIHGDGRLYLCEAPIDALSLRALYPGATVSATGGGFSVSRVAGLIEQAEVVYLAFDNDTAGADDIKKIRDGLPQYLHKMVDHQVPGAVKDWNKFLTG